MNLVSTSLNIECSVVDGRYIVKWNMSVPAGCGYPGGGVGTAIFDTPQKLTEWFKQQSERFI